MSEFNPSIHGLRAVLSYAFVAFLAATAIAIADDLPDPTRPPSVPASADVDDAQAIDSRASSQLVLNAIFFAEGRRIAIINNQRLGLGDLIGAAEITAIERDHVSLLRESEEIELHLITHDVKQLTTEATISRDPLITLSEAMPPASPATSDEADIAEVRNGLGEDTLNDFDSLAISREGSDE